MPSDPALRAHQEWLGTIQPVGLVVSPAALVAVGCVPDRNVSARQETLRGLLSGDPPRLLDFPAFARDLLGWEETDLAGAPGGPPLPESLSVALPNEHDTLRPTCEFLLDYEDEDDEGDDSGHARQRKKPWRYRWPDDIRDEVLARMLSLNKQRAARA